MNDNSFPMFEGQTLRKLAWQALWPIREYIRAAPYPRGKGFLVRRILTPVLPGDAVSFSFLMREGTKIDLRYREALGRSVLMNQGFEEAERRTLGRMAREGSTAIDVGANIGLFTLSLASAVGMEGAVFAFEAVPETADRLRSNLIQNSLANIEIIMAAAGDIDGKTEIVQSKDSAFSSTADVVDKHVRIQNRLDIDSIRIDTVWERAGRPDVSIIKIDVEGAEMAVLRGSGQLLQTCKPILMVEAPTSQHLLPIQGYLGQLGYVTEQPSGFMPWNYLFIHRDHEWQ